MKKVENEARKAGVGQKRSRAELKKMILEILELLPDGGVGEQVTEIQESKPTPQKREWIQ
jgi:hypothetical protein